MSRSSPSIARGRMVATPHPPQGAGVRRAQTGDRTRILDLMRISLGKGVIPRSEAFWEWKHERNPFGASPVLIAEMEGELAGLRAFLRWTWRSGAQDVTAVRAVDTATHPEHRGQGIFKWLTLQLRDEMEAEGVGLVYNTPNAQSRPGYLKMGWALVGKPALWVRPVRPVRLAKALRAEGLQGEEASPPEIAAPRASAALADARIADIVQAASSTPTRRAYHTEPRLDVMRWRYAEIPGFEYAVLTRGEGTDGAVAVVRSRQRGAVRELRVCELLVGSGRGARVNARRVLRDAAQCADVDVVIALPPAWIGARRALAASGFMPVPRSGPVLTVHPLHLSGAAPNPIRLQSWRPSIGDLELF